LTGDRLPLRSKIIDFAAHRASLRSNLSGSWRSEIIGFWACSAYRRAALRVIWFTAGRH